MNDVGICRIFLKWVKDSFGLDSEKVLRNWNICRSEDVGEIIFSLVKVGIIRVNCDGSDSAVGSQSADGHKKLQMTKSVHNRYVGRS